MCSFCNLFKPACNPCCRSSLDQHVDMRVVRGSNFSDFIGCCCPCGGNKGHDCCEKDKCDDWKCCEYKYKLCEKCDKKKCGDKCGDKCDDWKCNEYKAKLCEKCYKIKDDCKCGDDWKCCEYKYKICEKKDDCKKDKCGDDWDCCEYKYKVCEKCDKKKKCDYGKDDKCCDWRGCDKPELPELPSKPF